MKAKKLLVFLCLAIILLPTFACDEEDEPIPSPAPVTGYADLAITSIEIIPNQPAAGQEFTVTIRVKNEGTKISGSFDYSIYVRAEGTDSYYAPTGMEQSVHYGSGLQAGESVELVGYYPNGVPGRDPGEYYRAVAEIYPDSAEKYSGNNQATQTFAAY